MEFGSGIAEAVKGFEYVSIDVYDTLLVRPYVRPKDVFRHIEFSENAPGFMQERIASEKRCMESPEPTTLDRIYEGMPEEYRHLKEKELEYESNPVCPKKILDTYRKLLSEHRIVIISDMYLPGEFIRSLLKKNGIDGYEKFYLSSENGVSKDRGDMYGHVLKDLGIEKSQIIHIGDNAKSDYLVPKKLGFNAILVEKPRNAYFSRHRPVKRFYRKTESLERSIIVGMDIIRELQDSGDSFWKDVSYRFGGPLVSDYARFIINHRRENDSVLLAARDGYNIEKVLNILSPDIETHYVYVPRILNILIGSNYAQHNGYKARIVSEFYGETNDPDSFYDSHEEEIAGKRKELFDSYRAAVISETGNPAGISAVDVTTMKYTSQRLLSDLFPDSDILGIYYFLLYDDPGLPHCGYHVRDRMIKLADNINITEFFMTSPEPPITGIDENGHPKFREPSADEKVRLDIYGDVTAGETEYAADIVRMFGDRVPEFGFRDMHEWLKILIIGSGGYTRKNLASMKWAVDANHTQYISMIYHPRDTWFHIWKTVKDLMWYVSTKLH